MNYQFLQFFLLFELVSTFIHAQDSAKNNLKLAAIPIINYNRTQGFSAGGMVSGYYKVNRNDTVSPSSNTGILALYTAQQSYVLIGFQRFYLAQDRWRIVAGVGTANVNFQFYYDDPLVASSDFVNYTTKSSFASVQVQRKVVGKLYGGLIGQYISAKTTFAIPNAEGKDSSDERHLNNLGYIFSNDSRSNVNYPVKGVFINFKNQFYRDWIGSNNDYTRYLINYNQFFDLSKNEKNVLAVRASFDIATGDVPFEGQSVVGSDNIRGYSQGKYRGNQVYTAQTEYRWNFYKRFGMVGFFGLASAVENFNDIFNSKILPGIGAGLRFRMIPSEKINIGIDGAVGRGDYSISFRIGETFTR